MLARLNTIRTVGQTILSPSQSFAKAPAIFRRLADQRRHRLWQVVLVQGHERHVGAGGVLLLPGQNVFGKHFHADLHRCMKCAIQARLQRDYLADTNRITKIDVIDRGRYGHRATVPMRRYCRRYIHQVHDAAAQDIAEDVGILREHDLRHFRPRGTHGLPHQLPRNLRAFSLRHRTPPCLPDLFRPAQLVNQVLICRFEPDFVTPTTTGYNTRLRALAQLTP